MSDTLFKDKKFQATFVNCFFFFWEFINWFLLRLQIYLCLDKFWSKNPLLQLFLIATIPSPIGRATTTNSQSQTGGLFPVQTHTYCSLIPSFIYYYFPFFLFKLFVSKCFYLLSPAEKNQPTKHHRRIILTKKWNHRHHQRRKIQRR